MFWIVQKEIHARSLNLDLIDVLKRLEIKYLEVEVSQNKIHPLPDGISEDEQVMINGSIMLSNIARKNHWFAGQLFNDNFNYNIWSEKYREHLLNKDAIVSKLSDAIPLTGEFFVRPVLDNKSFNGQLFTKDKFLKFQENWLKDNNGANPNIEVLVSEKKKIGQEHRHYIVDGKVISSSRYKFDGTPNFKGGCDDRILDMVENVIKEWQPSRLFVLDTYVHGDEIGIVELGFLPHAGIYDADLMKIVGHIESMPNIEPNLEIIRKKSKKI